MSARPAGTGADAAGSSEPPSGSGRTVAAEPPSGSEHTRPGLALDPRTKLYLLLLSNVFLFVHCAPGMELALVGIIASAYLLSPKRRGALVWCAVYLGMFLTDQLVTPHADASWLFATVAALASGLRIMVPCLIAGAYAFTTTRPSELVAAMRRMRLPEGAVIPVLVVVRYFPTLRQECANILDSMRMRRIATSPAQLAAHPRSTVEHVLVPLLASASATAENLSMACLTKGTDNPDPHTCAVEIGFHPADAAYFALGLGLLAVQLAVL